jgi:hypothetical protein
MHALYAIVSCAGAAGSVASCGAGAMGAAALSLITNLLTDNPNETAQERETKGNLIASIVAGIAAIGGIDASAAATSAKVATDNNYLTQSQQQARAQAMASCSTSGDPSACQQKVREEFAKQWDANEASAKACASAQACKGVLSDLHEQQQAYAVRENELQGKLANGSITSAEFGELTSLRMSDTQFLALQTEALGNLTRLGGLNELGSTEAARLIAEMGIGAAPGLGEAAAAGIAGATKGAGARSPDATTYQGEILGANGTQVASKTVWKGSGQERIDVENPAPGVRPGQIHYQDSDGNKYYYDPNSKVLFDQKTGELAPRSVQDLLKIPSFSKAIDKALTGYLGAK